MTVRNLTPGARGFHGDTYLLTLVEALAREAQVFIETGANIGTTLGDVARRYPHLECFSCEPDLTAFQVARDHSMVRKGVHIFQETSQEFMGRLSRDHTAQFGKPLLAWLDAHDYGFEWPLREEIAYLTEKFRHGSILIDDFQVPGKPEFGWDQYDGRTCSFDYIESAINDKVAYRLYYPSYTEHTSPWHPLRGWGLLQFAPSLAELPELMDPLSEVCEQAAVREGSGGRGRLAPAMPDAERAEAIRQLRESAAASPENLAHWNDLGVHLALSGDYRSAIGAFGVALNIDPTHSEVGANLRQVSMAQLPEESLPLPIAPGRCGPMAARNPHDDLRSLVDSTSPLIVAGGAGGGNAVHLLRRQFPGATIHAFEPVRESALALRNSFPDDEKLTVHAALPSKSECLAALEVRAEDAMPLVLEPSDLREELLPADRGSSKEVEVLEVRIDSVLSTPVDAVVLDLQGREIRALEGAGSLLDGVRVILAKVGFIPLGEGQSTFSDLDAFMRSKGLRLFGLYNILLRADGQVTTGEAMYVNRKFYS